MAIPVFGKAQVKEGRVDIHTVPYGEKPNQVVVIKTFTVQGADLSEGFDEAAYDSTNPDDDSPLLHAEDKAREIEAELEAFKPTGIAIADAEGYLGVKAEVSLQGSPETPEALKSVALEVEISAFYDIPETELTQVLDQIAKKALEKIIK